MGYPVLKKEQSLLGQSSELERTNKDGLEISKTVRRTLPRRDPHPRESIPLAGGAKRLRSGAGT